jgi:membrane protein DedA with SNARE-associated domain
MLSEFADLVSTYRYWAIFPIALFEAPVMSIVIGFFAAAGYLNIFWAFGIVLAGDFIGDTVLYAAGRWWRDFFGRIGLRLNLPPDRQRRVLDYFARRDRHAIVISKLVHGVGFTGLITAGSLRVPFFRFITTCIVVSASQSVVLAAIGMLSGEAYRSFARAMGYVDIAITVLFLGFLFFLYRRITAKIGDDKSKD